MRRTARAPPIAPAPTNALELPESAATVVGAAVPLALETVEPELVAVAAAPASVAEADAEADDEEVEEEELDESVAVEFCPSMLVFTAALFLTMPLAESSHAMSAGVESLLGKLGEVMVTSLMDLMAGTWILSDVLVGRHRGD